jgi:hypothetical protein
MCGPSGLALSCTGNINYGLCCSVDHARVVSVAAGDANTGRQAVAVERL